MTSATYGNTDVRLVDLTVPNGWDRLLDRCPYMTRWRLKTLCSGLQAAARTVVIEPHYICRDFRNLFSHFYSKKFLPRDAHCSRVHFFRASGLDELQVTAHSDAWQSEYLGFGVIQPVVDRCLGRSVYDPLRLGRDPREFFCLQEQADWNALKDRMVGAEGGQSRARQRLVPAIDRLRDAPYSDQPRERQARTLQGAVPLTWIDSWAWLSGASHPHQPSDC